VSLEKKMKKYSPIYILLILSFILSACTSAPEQPLIPVETVFAATYAAIQAKTAAAMPSNTPTPIDTRRPTLTPYPSATTYVLILTQTFTPTITITPSPTNVTSGSGTVLYACEFLGQLPDSTYTAKPDEVIRWVWTVRNIGTTRWYPDSMFVAYANGAKIYAGKDKKFPLKTAANVGETGEFTIRLRAPKEPGKYTTVWALKKGIHNFCYATLVVNVKK